MTTITEAAQILTIFRVAYKHQRLTGDEFAEMVPIWHRLLQDIPFESLKAAAEHLAATSKWFPSVSELREAAFGLVAPEEHDQSGAEAWGEVEASFRDSRYEFQNPMAKAAYDALGGRGYFQHSLLEHAMSDRARFIEAYNAIQKRTVGRERMLPAVREFSDAKRLEANGLLDSVTRQNWWLTRRRIWYIVYVCWSSGGARNA